MLRTAQWATVLLAIVLMANGAAASAASPNGSKLNVVAAENFWGSIASQLGGDRVTVTSIIVNPSTDPHDYEPTASDAIKIAGSQFAIVNGIGYDTWADKLLAATPADHRTGLDVGELTGIRPGGNPHRWYSPADVHRVIERITADYRRIDPADASYFEARKAAFEKTALRSYDTLVARIRTTYAGTPVGASESIVSPLAAGLGLRMLTPQSFLDAVSEGSDPTARDKAAIDRQIRLRQIKLYIYNSQNSTPDVQAQIAEAEAAGIPVTTVTETLTPAGASFQDWQTRQLRGIERALATATGH